MIIDCLGNAPIEKINETLSIAIFNGETRLTRYFDGAEGCDKIILTREEAESIVDRLIREGVVE